MTDLSRSVELNILGNRKSEKEAVDQTVKDAAVINKLEPKLKIGGDAGGAKKAAAEATAAGEAFAKKEFKAKAGVEVGGAMGEIAALNAALTTLFGRKFSLKTAIDLPPDQLAKLNADLSKIGTTVSLDRIGNQMEALALKLRKMFSDNNVADFLDMNVDQAKIMQQIQLIKRKIQQATGIADFLDVNLNPAQIDAQLQILKRKMQAAGITDVLDFTLNDALIIQQLLRLSEKAPPIKIGTELTGKTGLPTLPGNETINIGIRETGSVAGSISQLLALAAASTKAADAAKYAYAAQVAMAAGEKLSGDAAGGGRGKIGAFGAAAAAAGGNFGFLTNKVTLFAGAFGKIPLLGVIPLWHILVTTIADLLAVIIPASIALATFGAAAVPTVQNLYHQMANVLTVSGAIGKTIPPMTGGFQAMANAVQPEVYSIFGAALAVINSKATEFQQIATGAGAVLDQLASRAQLALGSSGMSKFLKNAVADLQGLGTALGNIFGIIGNLLKSMPGYAEILLRVLDGVTSALEAVTASPIVQGLIKLGLGFHGAAIYVGLLVTGLAFLAPWMARFAGWAVGVNSTATATARLSANASRLDKTKAAFADLGTALSGSSISVGKFAGAAERGNNALVRIGLAAARLASNPWTWAAAAAVVIGILAFKIFTAKDATQQWLESLQNTINNQQSLIGALGSMQSVVGTVSVAYKGAQTSVKNLSNSMTTFGASQFQINNALNQQRLAVNENKQGLQNYTAEMDTARSRYSQLVQMFGSGAKAQQVLNSLNINSVNILRESSGQYKTDIQTLKDYQLAVQAVAQAMGQSGTAAYNAALNALNNTFITGTLPDIQKVTQAQDNLINMVIGGRQAWLGFEDAITGASAKLNTPPGLANAAAVAGASIGGLNAQSQALANSFYNDSIPSAQKLIDALQQQGLSFGDLSKVVATEVAQMIPFVGSNTEARSVLVDLINNAIGPGTVSLQNLNKWVGNNATSLQGMNAIVARSTLAAGQLANVLQNDLTAQFQKDLLASSGATAQMKVFTDAITHGGTQTQTYKNARAQLITDLENTGMSAKDAKTFVDNLQRSINAMHGKTVPVDANLTGSGGFSVSATGVTNKNFQLEHLRATGGLITGIGGPTSDNQILAASPGEYVIQASAVSQYGVGLMDAINARKFASGGLVDAAPFISLQAVSDIGSWSWQDISSWYNSDLTNWRKVSPGGGPFPGGSGGTPSGNALLAYSAYKSQMGPGDWPAWNYVAMAESGWNQFATNPSSGAYGIPQALPYTKLPITGQPLWAGGLSLAAPQIQWMWNYMKSVYGGPQGAAAHEANFHWYKNGGLIPEGVIGMGISSGDPYMFHAGEGVVSASNVRAGAMAGGDCYYITVSGDTDPDGAALRILQKLRDFKRHKGGQKLGLA